LGRQREAPVELDGQVVVKKNYELGIGQVTRWRERGGSDDEGKR